MPFDPYRPTGVERSPFLEHHRRSTAHRIDISQGWSSDGPNAAEKV